MKILGDWKAGSNLEKAGLSTSEMCQGHEGSKNSMSLEEQGYSLEWSGQGERGVSNAQDT